MKKLIYSLVFLSMLGSGLVGMDKKPTMEELMEQIKLLKSENKKLKKKVKKEFTDLSISSLIGDLFVLSIIREKSVLKKYQKKEYKYIPANEFLSKYLIPKILKKFDVLLKDIKTIQDLVKFVYTHFYGKWSNNFEKKMNFLISGYDMFIASDDDEKGEKKKKDKKKDEKELFTSVKEGKDFLKGFIEDWLKELPKLFKDKYINPLEILYQLDRPYSEIMKLYEINDEKRQEYFNERRIKDGKEKKEKKKENKIDTPLIIACNKMQSFQEKLGEIKYAKNLQEVSKRIAEATAQIVISILNGSITKNNYNALAPAMINCTQLYSPVQMFNMMDKPLFNELFKKIEKK